MLLNIVRRILIVQGCVIGLFLCAPAFAQKPVSKPEQAIANIGEQAWLRSSNVQTQSVDTAKLKGRVLLVINWSTKCAVCLDVMMELRNNVAGWRGKPFELIMINRDAKEQDYWDYLSLVKQLLPPNPQMTFIHAKELAVDNLFRPGALPLSFLIDDKGILKHIHTGRMPPEAWDQVAELIP